MPEPRSTRFGSSIGTKLTLATLAVLVSVSLLLYRELTRRERQALFAAKETAASMVADLFAASLSAPLDFADQDSIATELANLESNPEVICAAVFLKGEQIPVKRLDRGCDAGAPIPEGAMGRAIFAGDRVEVTRVVVGRKAPVGSARVVFSLARENAAFAASERQLAWLTFLLAVGTAAVLVIVSRTQIVVPLARLAEAARRIGGGDLATRIEVRGGDELGALAATFNRMSEEIGDRERQLAAATQNLRDLFDHMGQAIVAFDRDGLVRGATSRQASRLFASADLEARPIASLLFGSVPETDIELQAFEEWRASAFDVELDRWTEFAELAPKEVTIAGSVPLQLEFRPVAKQGRVERIMLLATDLSEQRRLEQAMTSQEAAHAKRTVAMRRLVAGGAQLFVRFIQTAGTRVAALFERVEDGATALDREAIDDMFRHVHTMKGEARAFDLGELEEALEALEETLSALRTNAAALADRDVAEDAASAVRTGLFRAEGAVERARQAFIDVSPIGSAALEQATVQRSDLEAVLALGKDRDDPLGRAIEHLGGRPFGEALATIADRVPEWAARDGKRVELVVEGREVRVPRALADVLPSVLTHLVRNAIAHGIEPPEARAERDKGPVGTIWATVEASDEHAPIVTLEDDGAGIDVTAVAHRARALGLDETKEAIDLIFEKGLSTRTTSDALAGRGVGLDAVRAYLADVAYEVDVITAPGQGTKFVLRPR